MARLPQDAKDWVAKAIDFYKASGKAIALAEFTNPQSQFVQDEMYIYALNPKGTMLAHGVNERFVGEDFIDVKDVDGESFIREIVDTANAKGSGWVEYKWFDPATREVLPKVVYFEKVDDLIICCGVYLVDPKLLIQQCRIYQNKSKEVISIPYADIYNFYRSLDEFVINGRKINITFPSELIKEGSFLAERILSCENGREFYEYLTSPLSDALELVEITSQHSLRDEIKKIKRNISLYNVYRIDCIYDEDHRQYLINLEPIGEGIRSVSFEIDIDGL